MLNSTLFSNDKILWMALRAGDIDAFEQLYRVHAGPLLTYGKRLCKDTNRVADAVQDVFFEIWKRRATLTTPNAIRFYLFRILRNRLVSQQNRTTDPLREAYDLVYADELIHAPSVETLIIESDSQQQRQSHLRRAIESLPPRQKEATALAYFHQFTNEEVAQIMGINTQSVTNHLSRAISALRERLTGDFWLIGWLLLFATRNLSMLQ